MVFLKHYRIVDQIGLVDLTDTIYTEYYMRQRFPYIYNLGKDYVLNTLVYNGFVSPEDCIMFKAKGYITEDLLIESIAHNLRGKFYYLKELTPELIISYLSAVVINSNFDMKELYFKTDMYLIGALHSSLYTEDDVFRSRMYEKQFKPVTDEQWKCLKLLHT